MSRSRCYPPAPRPRPRRQSPPSPDPPSRTPPHPQMPPLPKPFPHTYRSRALVGNRRWRPCRRLGADRRLCIGRAGLGGDQPGAGERGRRDRAGRAGRGLTAAIPVENPCCSCKLTRVLDEQAGLIQAQSNMFYKQGKELKQCALLGPFARRRRRCPPPPPSAACFAPLAPLAPPPTPSSRRQSSPSSRPLLCHTNCGELPGPIPSSHGKITVTVLAHLFVCILEVFTAVFDMHLWNIIGPSKYTQIGVLSLSCHSPHTPPCCCSGSIGHWTMDIGANCGHWRQVHSPCSNDRHPPMVMAPITSLLTIVASPICGSSGRSGGITLSSVHSLRSNHRLPSMEMAPITPCCSGGSGGRTSSCS